MSEIEPKQPYLAELYRYWDSKRGTRFAPTRADIDPVEIPHLLPRLFIWDVQDDPRDYVVRLFGTELTKRVGRELTGLRFHQVFKGPTAEKLWQDYAAVVDERRPVLSEYSADWAGKDFIQYERILLPLSDDGERVNRILGCAKSPQLS